jgi:hypothetical protein
MEFKGKQPVDQDIFVLEGRTCFHLGFHFLYFCSTIKVVYFGDHKMIRCVPLEDTHRKASFANAHHL